MTSLLTAKYSPKFKRATKRLANSGRPPDLIELKRIVKILAAGQILPTKHRDHKLTGPMADFRECHIRPDVLLVYKIVDEHRLLILADISSRAELFG